MFFLIKIPESWIKNRKIKLGEIVVQIDSWISQTLSLHTTNPNSKNREIMGDFCSFDLDPSSISLQFFLSRHPDRSPNPGPPRWFRHQVVSLPLLQFPQITRLRPRLQTCRWSQDRLATLRPVSLRCLDLLLPLCWTSVILHFFFFILMFWMNYCHFFSFQCIVDKISNIFCLISFWGIYWSCCNYGFCSHLSWYSCFFMEYGCFLFSSNDMIFWTVPSLMSADSRTEKNDPNNSGCIGTNWTEGYH